MISFCPRVVAASRQMLMLLHRVFFKVKPTQDEFSGVENALMGCKRHSLHFGLDHACIRKTCVRKY